MTTTRHCSILEFCRGAYKQAVAPCITRPLRHCFKPRKYTTLSHVAHQLSHTFLTENAVAITQVFSKENVRYSDSWDPIFSDFRDPIFNSRDPNRVPKAP